MRAVAINDFGARPTVVELPVPGPGPGELLVRVSASSVNGFDVAVAAGAYKSKLAHRFPVVLGKDFAGTVEGVGESASRFHLGEAVFGVVMKEGLGDGSFAQFVCVGEHPATALVPDGLDLESAGALGLAGATAVAAVEVVALQAGEVVLISGATGGVGALAIQLATALGAASVSQPRDVRDQVSARKLQGHRAVEPGCGISSWPAARRGYAAGKPRSATWKSPA